MASAGPSKRETVDERMFTTCTQTREGRAAGRPPNCRAVSIRYMSELEAQARAGKKDLPLNAVPLPYEGNRESLAPARDAVVVGPETKYWKPGGVYIWRSSSTFDLHRHLTEMHLDVNAQRRLQLMREGMQRQAAAWERANILHRMGKAPPPPTKRPRQLHPVSDSTTLVEVTPSHLRAELTSALSAVYTPALRLINTSIEQSAHSRLASNLVESVKRNNAAELWALVGRVTRDYQRLREEQRKAIEQATKETSPRKEKAP